MLSPAERFVSGGYSISRRSPRPERVSADLIQAQILSASTCICETVPDLWAIRWASIADAERVAAAARFGISSESVPLVMEWFTGHLDANTAGWPNVFYYLDVAREFVLRFLQDAGEYVILGIGLPERFVNDFLSNESSGPRLAVSGVYEMIRRGNAPDPSGRPLGFEILNYQYGTVHSWLCDGLEADVAVKYSIKPNPSGFISALEDAASAAQFCASGDAGSGSGEWLPWLITEYETRRS
ncbi:MAG: hypothetical protein HYX75_01955 [Acidobacteria bacterium]|nr:hypothetical protein [Acidobacteriota bacterium]